MEVHILSGANCVISMNTRWCVHVPAECTFLVFSGYSITNQAILVLLDGFVLLHVDDDNNTEVNIYGCSCISL